MKRLLLVGWFVEMMLSVSAEGIDDLCTPTSFGEDMEVINPRLKVIDGVLYAPGVGGIYKYTPEGEHTWTLWAMEGYNVAEFQVYGDEIVAVTIPTEYSKGNNAYARLVKGSVSSGVFKDVTIDAMMYSTKIGVLSYLCRLAQNPHNPQQLVTDAYSGLFVSDDFGNSWRNVTEITMSGFNYNEYLGWHPYKEDVLFYTSEGSFYEAEMLRFTNNFATMIYGDYNYVGDSSCHDLAYDPNDSNHILSSGEGIVYETHDCGVTWADATHFSFDGDDNPIDYAYRIIKAPMDDDTYYLISCGHTPTLEVKIFKSTDNFATMEMLMHSSDEDGYFWLSDAELYQGKLFLYTSHDIYIYDLGKENGIAEVRDDADAPTEYYTIEGLRLATEPESGFYILRQGNRVTKHIK